MKILRSVFVFVFVNVVWSILAVNHWAVNKDGLITAEYDSPFYLREPNNLATFLNQIKHYDIIQSTYVDVLHQMDRMMEDVDYSLKVRIELIDNFKCATKCQGPILGPTRLTRKYINRFNRNVKYELLVKPELPYCEQFLDFNIGICCFDHLDSLSNPGQLEIPAEEDMKDEELGIESDYFLADIISGLKKNPNSWKHHTLGSYYWRMKGNAYQAIECARRGILLAPREFKDIPMLSLGTILSNADKLSDADIVLNAAVDHAPDVAENHLALAKNLILLRNFNESIQPLEMVKKLDPSYLEKIKSIKEFVSCTVKLNKSMDKVDVYEEYFRKEVNGLRLMKNKMSASHDKLIQQQVPLGARYNDIELSKGPFANRGQYCTTRTVAGSDEPVLFCDFSSQTQILLEKMDEEIDSIEREMNASSESLRKKFSLELEKQLNSRRLNSKPSSD